MTALLDIADNEGGIGSSKSETVGEEGVKMPFQGVSGDEQVAGVFVWIFKIDTSADESVFHHQNGINHL